MAGLDSLPVGSTTSYSAPRRAIAIFNGPGSVRARLRSVRVVRTGLFALALSVPASTRAVTRLSSADGQYWDIQDTSPWSQDSGGIATGGRAYPFDGFGYLKLEVTRAEPGATSDRPPISNVSRPSGVSVSNLYLRGFGLAHDGAERFDSLTPVLHDGIVVRAIFAPSDTDYLRYFDTFFNSSTEPRVVRVAWGGATGAYEDGGRVTVATTSSGDRKIDPSDSFVTVMQNARGVADPLQGPSGHGPSAHVLGTRAGVLTSVGDMYADPFSDSYPGFAPAHIGYVFTLRLEPGQTVALVTFVVKGLSEVYDPRGGFPIAIKDGLLREYLTRLTLYDRHGPSFRALLALSPRAFADARARDADRRAGHVRSAFHGIPIVFKDNIDTTELPTTGGARALVDHRPRLDSRVAAGMKAGGAVVLGKANLDEFPFGDFGISSVGGTVGNAYDPSISTAGSSGGSATAVAASLAALAFGTDTCNSLSNPSAFASLATIRTTRGLTSRAGVMPLNTYNDAVGPMAKSVRDVALALDLVTGFDPEDPVTTDAGAHISGSFAGGLDSATLAGTRIGVLRQRFVGITGEREVSAAMDRVVKELAAAGAVPIGVAIPDYDATKHRRPPPTAR